MFAFGGKADMTLCGNSLLWSLLGVKRTSLFATDMSAFDPKRTSTDHETATCYLQYRLSTVSERVPENHAVKCPHLGLAEEQEP
jgi:hypothetical protein